MEVLATAPARTPSVDNGRVATTPETSSAQASDDRSNQSSENKLVVS